MNDTLRRFIAPFRMDIRTSARTVLGMLHSEGFVRVCGFIWNRIYDRWFEFRLGVRTGGMIQLKNLGIYNPDCNEYVATEYRFFKKVLNSLGVTPGNEVFLDYGAGMGRIVVLAATMPFKKVIGVEISPTLSALAVENLARAKSHLRCESVEIVTMDASHYDVPHDVSVVYVFNSFSGRTLSCVFSKLQESIQKRPRTMRVICNLPTQTPFEVEVRSQAWLTLESEFDFKKGFRWLVFVNKR